MKEVADISLGSMGLESIDRKATIKGDYRTVTKSQMASGIQGLMVMGMDQTTTFKKTPRRNASIE